MIDKSPEALALIKKSQAILDSPEVRAYKSQGTTWAQRAADYNRFLKSKGVELPKGYIIGQNGQIHENHDLRNGLLEAAVTLGGPLAAGLLMPAAGVANVGETTLEGTGGLIPGLSPHIGTVATIGGLAKTGLSTMDRINSVLHDTGKAVGDMTTAAGNNRLEANDAAAKAAHQNVVDKAAQEQAARSQADADRQSLYRYNVASNPVNSPYNTRPQTISPEMLAGLTDMEKQALARIQAGPAPYVPYVPKPASTLEKVGNVASPIMSTISTIAKYL